MRVRGTGEPCLYRDNSGVFQVFNSIKFAEREKSFGTASLLQKAASIDAGNMAAATEGRRDLNRGISPPESRSRPQDGPHDCGFFGPWRVQPGLHPPTFSMVHPKAAEWSFSRLHPLPFLPFEAPSVQRRRWKTALEKPSNSGA
jgi:hypothetical protein